MYQQILLCYDGTAEGRRALRHGADIAMAMKSRAYLLAICRNLLATAVPEGVTPELVRCEEDSANRLLSEGVQWLKDHGVPAEGQLVFGNPMVQIPEAAKRIGADLVVVGHRYRTRLAKWWSEEEEATLLNKLSCSILVAVDNPVP
ncbi:MAG TPA: universal stress protein [Steroidobacteraceae bacterium]|jgi:nucleotide-binding universal stress UspA family protein|nr:universal stress protein [Steroidobacteraceae bacterium]